MKDEELIKKARDVDPKEFDDLAEVYHGTDMSQEEFMAHVKVIAERHKESLDMLAKGDGYCPHEGMGYFTCPRCGCGEWKSYPQTVPADRSATWTYEYHCARCGHMMGLTIKGEE